MSSDPTPQQLTLRFDDVEALAAELESNLGLGRAFVPGGEGVAVRQRCELVLVHPEGGDSLALEAEAVWVKAEEPGAGIGLVLCGFDAGVAERLGRFAEGRKGGVAPPTDPHARVRLYNAAERIKAAREADYAERIALEQIYGKAVWEVLLRNPRITPPEVNRIARSPKLPKPLVETITGNAGWLSSSTLRRTLLMNPQLTGGALERVLRAMPAAELARIAKQSTFPMPVRQAAKRLTLR